MCFLVTTLGEHDEKGKAGPADQNIFLHSAASGQKIHSIHLDEEKQYRSSFLIAHYQLLCRVRVRVRV